MIGICGIGLRKYIERKKGVQTTTKFKSTYQEFIYKRTYARWLDKYKRREKWEDSVDRYRHFFESRIPPELQEAFLESLEAVYIGEVMPSMRCLWTAGEALEREHIAGYNCAYAPIDAIEAFSEILYILMNGTGVGFSVERQYIKDLPVVPLIADDKHTTIIFKDSKQGWAVGFHKYLKGLWSGHCFSYDLSEIRPKGSRLKTFGGRASGPEPLKELIEFSITLLKEASGRKLNSIECYDLVCKIASCVVVGGVRRSATLNLSNFSDQRMRHAKEGIFWIEHPQRWLSNNSVAYTDKPDITAFTEEWLSLIRGGSGERGIINRVSFQKTAKEIGRNPHYDFGVNPCGEIILRPNQFCNLTEVVVRDTDTLEILIAKVRAATLLGCIQSTLTDFGFLRDIWRKNCEEERLLGVSLTGLCDHPTLGRASTTSASWFIQLRRAARHEAERVAKVLGINTPAAITCVKPSGTVSQLADCASGIHPRFAKHYIRRVRVTEADPLCEFLKDKGVPWNPEVGETIEQHTTAVFDFYIAAPANCVTTKDRNAIQQLEYWKLLKTTWCEHNPSCTIYVKPDEWLDVGAWVYRHWDSIGGLSFIPAAGGSQPLSPYEEITEQAYTQGKRKEPTIDFTELDTYEATLGDTTTGAQEFACTGGSCELI